MIFKRRRRWLALAGGLVLVVILGAGLWVDADRQTPTSDYARVEPTSAGAPFIYDFGSYSGLPPQMNVIERDSNTEPLRVINGELAHGESTQEDAASYAELKFDSEVKRIGATANFDHAKESSEQGVIALLISDGPLDFNNPSRQPNAAVHFVAGRDSWLFSVWESEKGQKILQTGRYANIDVSHASYDIRVNGDVALVGLPDGQIVRVVDDRIRKFSGPYAAWELYEESPGMQGASFAAIWGGQG